MDFDYDYEYEDGCECGERFTGNVLIFYAIGLLKMVK